MSERATVWPVWQVSARAQRKERLLPESRAHPARMVPELARRLITTYSREGDLVLDPMCGIGTTLVEAIHAGRQALGIEYESRWADVARRNVAHAQASGGTGAGTVVTGDARVATRLLDRHAGSIALVVTSPPYGTSVHGRVRKQAGALLKFDSRYSDDRSNLAHQGYRRLMEGFEAILRECHALVRPGGVVAVTTRPWRVQHRLIDLPGAVVAAGERAGLVPDERLVALLCGLRGDTLVSHHSFFALENARRAHACGRPVRVVSHEDVIVLRRPG